MSEQRNDLDAILEMDLAVSTLNKNWHSLRQTDKNWNMKSAQNNIDKLVPLFSDLQAQWQETSQRLADQIDTIKTHMHTTAYVDELETEMKATGIQFSGDYPQYFLPPFKLVVAVDSLEARLSLGRKNERTSELNPRQLAAWVAVRYKKVLSRRFNAAAFMKDLLEAYKFASRLNYREKEVVWGRAVPIMDIYEMLTIRQTSRQDYPRQFFTFDLGLLKEAASLELDAYRFELGFPRNQSRAIVVVDSSGRESRISSLTIYLDEEGR